MIRFLRRVGGWKYDFGRVLGAFLPASLFFCVCFFQASLLVFFVCFVCSFQKFVLHSVCSFSSHKTRFSYFQLVALFTCECAQTILIIRIEARRGEARRLPSVCLASNVGSLAETEDRRQRMAAGGWRMGRFLASKQFVLCRFAASSNRNPFRRCIAVSASLCCSLAT